MSAPRLHVPEFLSANGTLVDVRSPSEFEAGHLPGAVNIALFTDEERARVGTLYKQQSREAAIDAGFEIAGPKMKYFADCAREAADDEGLRVYCWRGGMRSGHMSWLFETAGVQTSILEGGYKAYRNAMINDFTSLPALVVLQGSTGSGKTDVLLKMAAMGEQVVDLEGLANHRGSAFGALGMDPQPTTAHFHNLIYNQLCQFDLQKRIWVEGESKTIGKVYLPDALWEKMNSAKLVEIMVSKEDRIPRLVREYGQFSVSQLSDSVRRLTGRLGGEAVQELEDLISAGKLDIVASRLLDYYDEAYSYSRAKYKRKKNNQLDCTGKNCDNISETLIQNADSWNW